MTLYLKLLRYAKVILFFLQWVRVTGKENSEKLQTIFKRAFPLSALQLVVLRLNYRTHSLEADKMPHLAFTRRGVHVRLVEDVVATPTTCCRTAGHITSHHITSPTLK